MAGLPSKENSLNMKIIKPFSVKKNTMILMEIAILQLPLLTSKMKRTKFQLIWTDLKE